MSRLASMSFKTFVFPNNPVKLTIKDEKAVSETVLPFSGTAAETLAQKKRRISGEGWFIGEDSWQQWDTLQSLCRENTPGCLRLPYQMPFPAVAEQLHFLGTNGAGTVHYSFTFVECDHTEMTAPITCTAEQGDTLWDYAERFGKTLGALRAANPHVRDILELTPGQQVVIPCS